MRTTTYFCTLLVSLGLLAGCVITTNSDGSGGNGNGGSGGSGASGGSGGQGGQGGGGGSSAACYEATPASGTDSYAATFDAKEHTFTLTTPADPGGGVLELKGAGEQVFLTVLTDKGPNADILGASSGDTGVASLRIAAAPNTTYMVRLEENGVAPDGPAKTVGFDWNFRSVVDCYEPNDTNVTARPIPFDQPVNGYMFAGYTENDWPSGESHHDVFLVMADKAGKLRATLSSPVPTAVDILGSGSDTPLAGEWAIEAGVPVTAEIDAEAGGHYYVRLSPVGSLIYNDFDNGGAAPTNWSTPYTLTVTRQ